MQEETKTEEAEAAEKPAEEIKRETKEEVKVAPRNQVFVGKKPSMAYVLAAITQFTNGEPEVCIKARGRNISKAVDVAEIVQRRFMSDVKVKDIKIGTEEREVEGRKINISTIDILLAK